jgi:hypothetical protein
MLVLAVPGRSQLAITEVMTSASTNLAGQAVQEGSDFWELTNFGTNGAALSGYAWNDRGGSPNSEPFAGLVIGPGESIVFFRLKETRSAEAFRQWWGLAETVQVVPWGAQPGLSAAQESVEVRDAGGGLVDRVNVGQARQGVSFTYDLESGVFGTLSVKGTGNAFPAVTADDVGSPGSTAGPVATRVLEPPHDQTVDGGQDAVFVVQAAGLPPPRYQWSFRSALVVWATSSVLTLTNVQPADAGLYAVEVHDVVGPPARLAATLTVNTTPHAPAIVKGLDDAVVFPGQAATFAVRATGYPPFTCQWSSNGLELPDAQGTALVVSDTEEVQSGTQYSVVVRNALGAAESSARLWVQRKPALHITEVMAWPSTNAVPDHNDWWELTNLDTNVVRLGGWRFFDAPDVLARGIPCAVAEGVAIQPGESVIFVEGMSRDAFVAWWGATNLPPNLIVVPYAGFGLSSLGDTLHLWNPAATDPLDAVATVMFAMSTLGVSMQFTPGQWLATDSEAGVDGGFRAVEADDVGSPGYSQHAPPRFLNVALGEGHVTLVWQAVAGNRYRLESRPCLDGLGDWADAGTFTASGRTITVQEPVPLDGSARFFRIQVVP